MRSRGTRAGAVMTAALVALTSILVLTSGRGVASATSASPSIPSVPANATVNMPVLAYYETGYTTQSWVRDRRDAPALGLYPSTNREVIRQHVQMARAAGVTGFIVHWRSSEPRNQVLDALVEEARAQNFKLAIEYGVDREGLNPRDKWNGLPKKFWNWYHRYEKRPGDPDLTKGEACALYGEWCDAGCPNGPL